MRAPATDLARRLFAAAGPDALPFWADGGGTSRHLLAVAPDRVIRVPVARDRAAIAEALRELVPPASGAREPLVVFGLSYDAGRALEVIGPGPEDDLGLPDLIVARYPGYLESDGATDDWRARGDVGALVRALETTGAATAATRDAPLTLADPRPRAAYVDGVAEVIARLRAGDLYQANVARRLEGPCPPERVPELYLALRAVQPAPHGALWRLDDATWIASNSPECLLRWDAASRTARSYPIKGTRPRAAETHADNAARDALAASDKDRAEHLMIVDLVRNDLGRVARTGSVRVESLFEVMTLATVHHLVSTIACELDGAHDLVDALLALFPGGSITGAPKIAAMRLIDRVEGMRRGFYCGSLGVVLGGAEAVASILIRTLVATRGRVVYATGGGIVVDSDPDGEWDETETKALALRRALERHRQRHPESP